MNANEFTLLDQDFNEHKLSDYLGKWVILYFYPKDDTSGCTKEACGFRDGILELQKLGAVVLGISKDSVISHKRFAEKFKLNFPLLSDESKDIIKSYDAWGHKKFMGREFDGILRKTFLINREGEIVKVYEKVNPTQHVEDVLRDLKLMTGNS